ncbi:MAG: hypothetical protein HRT34_08985 [Alcanivorax sp.]|nr:hypothetical protein [Alcanivorax sp.]
MWIAGFALEAVADRQKSAFRAARDAWNQQNGGAS